MNYTRYAERLKPKSNLVEPTTVTAQMSNISCGEA